MACSCAHPAHEHRAISQARGPAARTQRALKLATAALAATAGVPAPKPHLPASRLASALTLCASDSVCRGRLQRCELPILMLMLALPTIGLLALRCVDALAPLFHDPALQLLRPAHHRHPHLSTCSSASCCAMLAPLSRLLLDLHPALLLLLLLDFLLLILLLTPFVVSGSLFVVLRAGV